MSKKILFLSVTVLSVLYLHIAVASAESQSKHKEIKLIMATNVTPVYPYIGKGMKTFVDMVNERGKGVVQIDMYWGGALLKGKQLLPGLRAGTADMIWVSSSYLAGDFPSLGIQSLPLWKTLEKSYEDRKIGSPLAVWQNQELKKKNLKQLLTSGMIPEVLFTRKKLVRCPEDMKGLKIRVPGKIEAKAVYAMGAFPVSIPSAEHGHALSRGVVDGSIITPWTAKGRGIEEFCKYMLDYPFGGINASIFVLNDRWESWSEDVQKIIMDAAIESERLFIGPAGATLNDGQYKGEVIPYYESKGLEAVYLTDAETSKFDKAIEPIIKWWIKKVGTETGEKAIGYIQRD